MSVILTLEWSSRRLSAAVGGPGVPGNERVVELPRFRAPAAVGLVDTLLEEAGIRLNEVTDIRIGRGPGNYTGVRQAFAWAAGACAPGNISLVAVSSGRAQARRLQTRFPEGFWILGDARRGHWWGARAGEQMMWELASPEEWRRRVGDDPVVSAEAERLEGLPELVADAPRATDLLEWIPEPPDEAPEPLYLHPPVSG